MIWQLPFMPFPETPPIHTMSDYSHLKGYLHSSTLKWSYGAMKGRPPHYWMEQISLLPIDQMLKQLSIAGFAGVYVDRFGYKNPGQDIEEHLQNTLHISPIVSRNNRLAFYPMTKYNDELRKQYSQADLDKQRIEMGLVIQWGGDFSVQESSPEGTWRWCGRKGILSIRNVAEKTRTITIQTHLATGHREKSMLVIKSSLFEDELSVNDLGELYEKTFSLPGNTEEKITFTSSAKKVDAPGDPRFLVFRLLHYSLEEKKD
jgi:phosphoglycerol transferase